MLETKMYYNLLFCDHLQCMCTRHYSQWKNVLKLLTFNYFSFMSEKSI